MKRKVADEQDDDKPVESGRRPVEGAQVEKKRKSSMHNRGVREAFPEDMTVQGFFEMECKRSIQQLTNKARERCEELRNELANARREVLNSIDAEKENISEDAPMAYDIIVQATEGPYAGNDYILHLDTKGKKSCLIGRSTGRKFRLPHGLSLPKDSEVSTTHAEIKIDEQGSVYFVDLDSTNGSIIKEEPVEPREPYLMSTDTPSIVKIGGSSLVISFAKRDS